MRIAFCRELQRQPLMLVDACIALILCIAFQPAFASLHEMDGDPLPKASPAVEAAVEAARKTPLPDYGALHASGHIKEVLERVTGDTTAIESLRQNGQGVLFAPGRTEADRCNSQTDPTCLAVQVVDRTSTTKPTIDPDAAGDIIGGRDEVVDKADDMVNVEGNGSSTGTCRPNTETVVKPSVTHTCDVRVNAESASTTNTCTTAWESILEEASKWVCRIVERKDFSASCSVPVVVAQETTSTVACWEGVKNPDVMSCPVSVSTEIKTKHLASCLRPKFKKIERRCSRRLVVKPEATCRVGDTTKASNTDWAVLMQDAVPGADTLEVSVVCQETKEGAMPLVTFATNAAAGLAPALSVSTREAVFDVPMAVADGTVRFSGSTSCRASQCVSSVRMSVHAGTGSNAVYSGEVFVRLVFVRFMKTGESEHWTETCTGVDA